MLVLTRRRGDRVRIGDNVWVTVIDIDRGKIRLGFDAPRSVEIMRCELERPGTTAGSSPATQSESHP